MKTRTAWSGFTLIEILVVVSIIGILSAVLYANFGSARQEARNKAMQTELIEVQLALELYKAQNNEYPDAASCGGSTFGVDWADTDNCATTPIINGLVPDFIAELPVSADSGNSNCNIRYQVDSADHSWYKLTAENCHAGATSAAEGVQPDSEFAECLDINTADCNTYCTPTHIASPSFYESYAVYSAGGECK